MRQAFDIQPADGKLGILIPGWAPWPRTVIAGVFAVRKKPGEADRLTDPDGHHPPGQANRKALPPDQGLRAAG